MNAGELRNRIEVLELRQENDSFAWRPVRTIWVKVKRENKTNLFSKIGLGQPSVVFTIRKCELTLFQAIRYAGEHCFLTDIEENDDRLYMTVRAAAVPLSVCAVKHQGVNLDNELDTPEYVDLGETVFPAVLTEKYVRQVQDAPYAVTETAYVLVTPKVVRLKPEQMVQVDGRKYVIRTAHELDTYKNEFEIFRKEDASCRVWT